MKKGKKMKGIILAGGTATRLFPLTHTTSKQLLPVYDRQMIFYPLNTLVRAGIKEILIIIAPRDAGQFLNLLGPIFDRHEVRLDFKVQSAPRGLAEAFILGEDFIDDGDVTMILGDNIFEDDFSDIIRNFKSGGHVFAKKVPDPERYGVVKFDKSGKAIRIVEKPQEWISDFAIPGLYVFDNRVCEVAKSSRPSDRGEIEITDLMNFYLEKGELKVSQVKGDWLDAGTFDTLLESSQIVKEKKLYENFDPEVEKAIAEFNEEQKALAKKQLV
jgi:glucose-1-phosphate thymidylyltransferase